MLAVRRSLSTLLRTTPSVRAGLGPVSSEVQRMEVSATWPDGPILGSLSRRQLTTTPARSDLMEFFDDKSNWGQRSVRVGRSWKKDELRLKSNEDLHKLCEQQSTEAVTLNSYIKRFAALVSTLGRSMYSVGKKMTETRFVLLKERNMLLTMQDVYKQAHEPMPNEERIDKVDESMENLEEVVRERNRAFYELEVGGSGEEEREIILGPLGLEVGYVHKENPMPIWQNPDLNLLVRSRFRTTFGKEVRSFYRKYREQLHRYESQSKLKQLARAARILKRFPNTKKEALEEWFPRLTYDEVIRYSRSRSATRNAHLDVRG